MNNNGLCIWFTGLSGSGKSTLANSIATVLRKDRTVTLLDGDVIRQYLSKGLGFSKEDRDTHILRLGYISKLITDHDGIVITATISPYKSIRCQNRKLITNYMEVYCKCPLEECEIRDVKGLYTKARKALQDGKPMKFTGIDDPYEEPSDPEIIVNTSEESIEESTNKILHQINSYKRIKPQQQEEFIPDELIEKTKLILNGQIHSGILMRELNVGHDTAIRIIDELGKRGLISIKQ